MSEIELFILIISGYFTYRFLKNWYQLYFNIRLSKRNETVRYILGGLPIVSFIILFYTLKVLASYDVVNSPLFITFYLLLGYTWIFFGLLAMAYFFDLSWKDDAMDLNNKAAILSVAGGFLGMTIIFAGANLGDGPGWWCVIFAGGLGFCVWIVLGMIINSAAKVFERITVERDISCGIRFGFYLLGSGIILGRASAGDWTSFSQTVVEFKAGWPVILLTLFAIGTERIVMHRSETEDKTAGFPAGSMLLGILYVLAAVAAVRLLPNIPENPIYHTLSIMMNA